MRTCIAILAFSFAVALRGDLVGIGSLEQVVRDSDVILVGQLAEVTTAASVPGSADNRGTLTVIPVESLKGRLPQAPMRVSFEKMTYIGRLPLSRNILIFAKVTAQPVAYTLVPLESGGATSLRDNLFEAEPSPSPKLYRIHSGDSDLKKVLKQLLYNYATSPSPSALPYLMQIGADHPDAGLLRAAYREMLHGTRPDGFQRASLGFALFGGLESIQILDSNPGLTWDKDHDALGNLEYTYRDTSPEGVAILSRWLQPDRPAKIRETAAAALTRIHTAGATQVLAPYLRDPDFEIRWRVVRALSLYAAGISIELPFRPASANAADSRFLSIPANIRTSREEILDEGESGYLSFWADWWEQQRGKVARAAASGAR